MAKSMVRAHTQHLSRFKPNKRPESWATGLLLQVWDVSFEMWEHRNEKVHGDTLTPTQSTELAALRRRVNAEFSKGSIALLKEHRWMLNENCKEWALTQSYTRTTKWVETIHLSRKGYQLQQTKLNTTLARQQQALRQWLVHVVAPTDE
jgi:hypothetical protein